MEKLCLNCKKDISNKKRRTSKFCSLQCIQDYKLNERVKLLESGLVACSQTIKRCVIKRDGIKCSICNRSTWEGNQIPLVLDHIDGNSNNNLGSNLRLVCGNCDMLLPTYKNKNKGRGRFYRNQRYYQGKSY